MRYKDMTIREVIKGLQKVGSHVIHCNNRAKIYLTSMDDDEQTMSYFKTINGKRICRHIYCYISEKEGVKIIPEIDKYELKDWSKENYIVPERVMNLLISCNGGINEYKTLSEPQYMIANAMSILNDMESMWGE